nr:unnamed protein product [Digitaria exilis]
MASGRVISLDLGGLDLMSPRLDPSLFNLTSLRNLSLAFIDFNSASLPAFGFEQLTDLVNLNLSETNFWGQIPIGFFSCLKKLVTIDLSGNLTKLHALNIYDSNFSGPIPSTIGNLVQLEELSIDLTPTI